MELETLHKMFSVITHLTAWRNRLTTSLNHHKFTYTTAVYINTTCKQEISTILSLLEVIVYRIAYMQQFRISTARIDMTNDSLV